MGRFYNDTAGTQILIVVSACYPIWFRCRVICIRVPPIWFSRSTVWNSDQQCPHFTDAVTEAQHVKPSHSWYATWPSSSAPSSTLCPCHHETTTCSDNGVCEEDSACISVSSVTLCKVGTYSHPRPPHRRMDIKQQKKLIDFIGKKRLSLNSVPWLNLGTSAY